MATGKTPSKIALDWSRLLGFDQAPRVTGQADAGPPAKVGGKIGGKIGVKTGTKPGVKRRG
jgi:hypothetical protein